MPIACYFVTSLNYKSILKKGCFDCYLNYQFLIIYIYTLSTFRCSTQTSCQNMEAVGLSPSWTLNLITEKEMFTQNIDNLHVIEYRY